MIKITQGDALGIALKAVDGARIPVNLTDATFSTKIRGANGVVVTFNNSKHTPAPDQDTNTGEYTLNLNAVDTASLGVGDTKEIITQITIGSSIIHYHGFAILTVYPNVPTQ